MKALPVIGFTEEEVQVSNAQLFDRRFLCH